MRIKVCSQVHNVIGSNCAISCPVIYIHVRASTNTNTNTNTNRELKEKLWHYKSVTLIFVKTVSRFCQNSLLCMCYGKRTPKIQSGVQLSKWTEKAVRRILFKLTRTARDHTFQSLLHDFDRAFLPRRPHTVQAYLLPNPQVVDLKRSHNHFNSEKYKTTISATFLPKYSPCATMHFCQQSWRFGKHS